jgi:hypothetical protein
MTMMGPLASASVEELLAALLDRTGTQPGPNAVEFSSSGRPRDGSAWRVATVPIGRDHSASIYVHADDMAALGRAANA